MTPENISVTINDLKKVFNELVCEKTDNCSECPLQVPGLPCKFTDLIEFLESCENLHARHNKLLEHCSTIVEDRDRYAKFLVSIEYMRLKDGTTICKLDDEHYSITRNFTAGFANELMYEVEGL